MSVARILEHKGHSVATIREDETLAKTAELLDELGIGALVVMDKHDRPVAVVSERDIVREVALHGKASLSRPVALIATPAFVTASLEETVNEVMIRMTDRRVRHLPVLEDGRLVGIVSIGDVVKAKIADVEAQTAALRSYILS